jgi:cytidylate kinase
MGVVAISDTAGSLGSEIGQAVAAKLGYQFADREIISKAAERFGEGVLELTHATEEKPTIWERLTETQGRYIAYVEAIVLEMAARDNVVMVGRASTIILRATPLALRVRITAPEATRARRIQEQQGLTPEAAFDFVRQSDRERAARVKFLYHVDWGDPLLYDLGINTERLSVDRAARLIKEALDAERFQASATLARTVQDLSLAAQAKAALRANAVTRARHIFVSCADGHVTLSGAVQTEGERRTAQEVVASIPGVAGVLNDVVAPPANIRRFRGM